uniref:hypothetical protein n=1 Tax=Pseudomonadati TaxID=3379134 RepID=UPI0015EEBF58|nr:MULTISPECIES: hypothetical protein [Bacteria]
MGFALVALAIPGRAPGGTAGPQIVKFASQPSFKVLTMTTLNPIKKNALAIGIRRDECPVIARSEGDASVLKKQFSKLRKVLAGIPLGVDPAIELKKTRNKRGLV